MRNWLFLGLFLFCVLGCSSYAIKGPELETPREDEAEPTAPDVFDEDLK